MHDLSLYLLEVLENSVRAEATRVDIGLFIDEASDQLRLSVDDDGRGLATTPEQTLDPFYTTKPGKKTGLGLSLLRAEAQAAGGDLTIGPSPTLGGVRVEAVMRWNHVDRPPLGDIGTTIIVTAAMNPGIEFTVSLAGDQFVPPLRHAPPLEAAGRLAGERPAGRPAERCTKESTDKGVENMANESEKPDRNCPGGCEEASEEELLARLDEVIESYKGKPGALIPVLQLAQGIFGYLPEVALKRIAKKMNKSYSEVAGVVGFYSFFSTVPRRVPEEGVGDRRRRGDRRPRVLSGGGPLIRSMRLGPRDHGQRHRPPSGQAGSDQRDPCPVRLHGEGTRHSRGR